MSMKSASILLCALTAGLTGCTGTPNRGLESVHQPVVSRADYVFDFASDGSAVNPDDTTRLSGWFDSLKIGYGDRISIDPNGAGDVSGARQIVGTLAARRGLLLEPAYPITQGQIPAGYVRVIVSRMTADVPGCPDQSRVDAVNYGNHMSSSYGCAVNTNLARMVADPLDLLEGRQSDGAGDSATSAKAIKTHRERANTGAGGLTSEKVSN
jgi:pilus assembly protein CpaD